MLEGERFVVERMDRDAFAGRIRKAQEGLGTPDKDIKARIAAIPDQVYANAVNFGPGWILFTTAEPYTEEELAVAGRFADVFAVAYSRFLELKELEDQNRELTIQNALEKVRSRALGMRESEELGEVVWDMYEEVTGLGFDLTTANINVHRTDENEADVWSASSDCDRSQGSAYTRLTGIQANKRWEIFKAGKDHGDRWHTEEMTIPLRPDQILYVHRVFFSHGYVAFNNYSGQFIEEDLEVLCRFTNAFEFAYQRFLELQAKEDQNRELTIQNAIERVRSRALGMQKSSELDEVKVALFEALGELDFDLFWCGVWLVDETRDLMTVSVQFSGAERLVQNGTSIRESMEASAVTRSLVEAYRRQEDAYALKVTDQDVPDHLNYWVPVVQETNPDWQMPQALAEADTFYQSGSYFRYGALEITTPQELDRDNQDVRRRFTEVFAFAYNRFLELKKKEEQVREADRRAAVDRVRAVATAMEGTEDIANVVKELWEGLVGQGLVFSTLTFQVEDQQDQEFQMYLATLGGSGGLVFPDSKMLTREMVPGVNLYRSGIALSDMPAERLENRRTRGVHSGLQGGNDGVMRALFGIDLPKDLRDRLQQLLVPFEFGQISVYREDESFTEPDVDMLEPFAEAASLGFTRYFDFRRLEAQNVALEEANEEVRTATRLKSQFLANMSHELRTPMNAIIGFTRLVTRRGSDNLTERQLGNLDKVQVSADHLLNLINEILDLSKVEAGRVDIQAKNFRIEPLLQGACATVGPTMGKDGVQVNCEVGAGVGEMYSDEARIRQVVINLLSNALKFTDTGSVRVAASIKSAGRRGQGAEELLEISVSDTGIGIPEDELGHIFEEFRQVDGSSTRRHQGTGLGLAITKKLVELLGGSIAVTSVVGEGSTFTIELPVKYGQSGGAGEERAGDGSPTAHSRLPTPASDSRGAGGQGAGGKGQEPRRVIVSIDDDPNVAVLLRQELEGDGYRVISALNADEGVALVKKHQPAAVTVDILMPGKDGWETIGMLKGDPETRDVPIIVVSAMDNRDLGISMGVKDYLVKPVDREALLSALKKIDPGMKHVLIVDDEPSARDLLVEILGDEGLTTRTAVNGREALLRIEEEIPDAILLDLMMPEVDGFEVVQKLQENESWKGIPVIVVTAKDLELEEKTFLSERVERVVQKGRLEPEELGRVVREAIAAEEQRGRGQGGRGK